MTEPDDLFGEETDDAPEGALSVLRRGIDASPVLRAGLAITALLGLAVAVGRLVTPVLLQLAIDRGVLGDEGVKPDLVLAYSLGAAVLLVLSGYVSFATRRRLIIRSEAAIAQLRADAFDQVHRLSIADHNETRRGILVSRVTSDADALARFAEWGLFAWTTQPFVILGTFAVLAAYSWQLALVAVVAYAPVLPVLKVIQKQQLAAHDDLRTRTGRMLATFSEALTGASVIRAYGAEQRTRQRLLAVSDGQYRAALRTNRYMAMVFVVGDLFGALSFVSVLVVGVWWHESLGVSAGVLVACLFLTTIVHEPVAELGETLDQTQKAVAGWRKILNLLDHTPDIPEPVAGQAIPTGPIRVEADGVTFAYRRSPPAIIDVSVVIEAGSNTAIVGETGSGKTTFAKLLCRLADPTTGEIRLNGTALPEVSPESRLESVRMVPQDGFLFDTSIRENIRYGRPSASDAEIHDALTLIELEDWADKFPNGLDTRVGERGDFLSVGERQLVALARASLADPGLLILDEATSAVDPETDQAMTTALRRLAADRTIVSIAHRLATAEAADRILVFDEGRLVEQGSHAELQPQGGVYSRLHTAWVGSTTRG